jgi:hypothetical protein
MILRTRTGLLLLALALATTVTACMATPTPATSVSATPTPTPSQTTMSPAEEDLTKAKAAVVKLWEVVDALTNDPKSSIQDLDAVASGQVLTMFQENLGTYRAQGWTGSGSAVVENPTAELAGTNAQGLTTWAVTACVDRSHTTLVDAKGKSVQLPPYRIIHSSTVVQRSGLLKVEQDQATGTC